MSAYMFGFLDPVWRLARSKHTYSTEPLHPLQRLPLVEQALLQWRVPRVDEVVLNVGLWDAVVLASTPGLLEDTRWEEMWTQRAIAFIERVKETWPAAAWSWSTTPPVHHGHYATGHSLENISMRLSALGAHAACATSTPALDWRATLCNSSRYRMMIDGLHWAGAAPYQERLETVAAPGANARQDSCAVRTDWCAVLTG